MLKKSFVIESEKDSSITLKITPGHFSTGNSHISHYLDMSRLKTNAIVAQDVAKEIAIPIIGGWDVVETIICMEGTEIIGAYLAQKLLDNGMMAMNSGGAIYVVTPSTASNGQLVFQHSEQEHVLGKSTILLVASVSTGETVSRSLECLRLYGGKLVGICALFSALTEVNGNGIASLFAMEDIPSYRFSVLDACEMCKSGEPIDALVSEGGYTIITE